MKVHFHAPPHVRSRMEGGAAQFWSPLAQVVERMGGEVVLREYEARSHRTIAADDGALHVVNNGAIRQANVLNAGLAYVDGFWHLDPVGVLAVSSIGDRRFDPGAVPLQEARTFFRRLRGRFVERRRSRYKQPKRGLRGAMPEGAVALFLQGASHLTDRSRVFSTPDMIRSVSLGTDRPVRVKAHPLKVAPEDVAAVEEMAAQGRDIAMIEGNVHDILTHCCASVSISSACSFEGFMHRKPAVLFGRSDFTQNAVTVEALDGFGAALDEALTRRWPHVGFVHWYLAQQSLWVEAEDFEARLENILAEAGMRAVPDGVLELLRGKRRVG